VELPFPIKVEIKCAALGPNFALFLSQTGLVFAMGENGRGQLGHGDRHYRPLPYMVKGLKEEKEKVSIISCGYRHSIAMTSSGRIFTWGAGD